MYEEDRRELAEGADDPRAGGNVLFDDACVTIRYRSVSKRKPTSRVQFCAVCLSASASAMQQIKLERPRFSILQEQLFQP